MFFGKQRFVILILLCTVFSVSSIAQTNFEENDPEILENGIRLLRKYFQEKKQWYVTQPDVGENVIGLVNFISDEPIDSILPELKSTFEEDQLYVFRLPEHVEDSLMVPGYYREERVEEDIERMGIQLQKQYQERKIIIPERMLADLDKKLDLIGEGKGMQLFSDSVYNMPDSLFIPEIIPDSVLNSPEQFEELRLKDSIRNDYVERMRITYNDSLIQVYTDSLTTKLRKEQFENEYNYQKKRIRDSVRVNNYNVLREYNEKVIQSVNDSIEVFLRTLVEYADYIDSTLIEVTNLKGEKSHIPLHGGKEIYSRIWLKNKQDDSLSLIVRNTGKRSMEMLIDDGVRFSRFTTKQTKDFDFKSLERDVSNLTNVGQSYKVETPWNIGGDGNIGFTQTYMQNWKKGGQSAISSLIVLRGSANYTRSDGKVKWENSGEFRNGWIKPGNKGAEVQKNDDKLEFTSRYGVSAFKKWYYSAEFNWETQLFKGYRYPTSKYPEPISAFMAPARTFFKIGLEYKPDKTFSLLVSPLTLKNVFVRDTTLIDQTKYGILPNKRSFWEPGLNADIKIKKDLTPEISYETKYKMFINYGAPFRKFDINWENLFVFTLTDYIDMRMMMHFIYDDKVLFPIEDENGNKIGEKPKLQVKEFISIGFSYKINRKVIRTRRIR